MTQKTLEFNLDKDSTLYFLHIPKTAGTTLMAILEEHFDYDSILQPHDWQALLANFPKDFSKIRIARGHFGYGFHRCLPKPPVYITMLRDPTNKIMSMYHQMLQDAAKRGKSKYSKMSLLEMINTTKKKKHIFSKHQTRHLALDLDIISSTKNFNHLEKVSFSLEKSSEFLFPEISDEDLLELAKKHLSSFPFFGLMERFEDSLNLLCYVFGWRPIKFVKKRNVTPDSIKKELDEETNSAISKLIQLDNQLYQYAKNLFEENINQMTKDLKNKFYNVKMKNLSPTELIFQLLEQNYEQRIQKQKILLQESIDYNFIEKISGTGWYYRALNENKQSGLRWTGPSTESSIDFSLKRDKDLIIRFCIKPIKKKLLENLTLHIDGTQIDLKISAENMGTVIFEGSISKLIKPEEKKFSRLMFNIDKTFNPSSLITSSKDTRKLGLLFYWIKIFHA